MRKPGLFEMKRGTGEVALGADNEKAQDEIPSTRQPGAG